MGTKVEDIAHLSRLDALKLALINAKLNYSFVHHFFVNREVAAAVQVDVILTRRADRLEFVAKFGKGPAAGKGDVGVVPQAKAVVAALVSLDDRLVVGLQVFLTGVDAIHILHNKLTPTHDTTLGAQLVAEFVLELVDADGQVFVALEVTAQ